MADQALLKQAVATGDIESFSVISSFFNKYDVVFKNLSGVSL